MGLNLFSNANETYADLEFTDINIILNELAQKAHFNKTKELIHSFLVYRDISAIENDYKAMGYFIDDWGSDTHTQIHSSILALPEDIGAAEKAISYLEKGAVLGLADLNKLCLFLEAYSKCRRFLERWGESAQFFAVSLSGFARLKSEFIDGLRRFVFPSGEVDYLRHPELRALFEEMVRIDSIIRKKVLETVSDATFAPVLQFSNYDVINDHFVVPVRSDSYNSSLGQIISRSETGMTLYVEPYEIKDLCTKRANLMAQIDEKILKICQAFCQYLMEHTPYLHSSLALFSRLDLLFSRGRYCVEKKLHCPSFSTEKEIKIYGLFHPLIPNCVSNDILLSNHEKGYIISGPNTGGKTVSMKALMLSMIFPHLGLFVPASEAHFFLFRGVFFLSHDQQNIQEGLSSFSSQVLKYFNLFNQLESDNIIFIDEIFNSTSSEEASALAYSIIDELGQGSHNKIFVSTHHQLLKTLMFDRPEFISCHVGIDQSTQKPNYKIVTGAPGSSFALGIFENLSERFGFARKHLIKKAKEIINNNHFNFEDIYRKLELTQAELDVKMTEALKFEEELRKKEESFLTSQKLNAKKKLEQMDEKLASILMEAREELERIKKSESNDIKDLQHKIAQIREVKREFVVEESTATQGSESVESLQIGQTYLCLPLNSKVILKGIHHKSGSAEVSINGKIVKCKISDLAKAGQKNSPPAPKYKFHFEQNYSSEQSTQIDCRGMRLDDFINQVELHVDHLLRGDVPFLHIIHGHGDGILKRWLRNEYLKIHPEFSYEIPESSRDGSTRIFLR